mmetsp:Transcript_379/g.801  ORF Transcript_379/g.801 Transcript_379/m.801 type:complete len:204 (-) Transcript_379:431-1042(-)
MERASIRQENGWLLATQLKVFQLSWCSCHVCPTKGCRGRSQCRNFDQGQPKGQENPIGSRKCRNAPWKVPYRILQDPETRRRRRRRPLAVPTLQGLYTGCQTEFGSVAPSGYLDDSPQEVPLLPKMERKDLDQSELPPHGSRHEKMVPQRITRSSRQLFGRFVRLRSHWRPQSLRRHDRGSLRGNLQGNTLQQRRTGRSSLRL